MASAIDSGVSDASRFGARIDQWLGISPSARGLAPSGHADTPRRLFGLRVAAILEIGLALILAVLIDRFLGANDRYATISPHPFWIVVVLAAGYYGVLEGLLAAALATLALLWGHLPAQLLDEDLNAWLLRVSVVPLPWFVVALLLGSMQDAFRRRYEEVREQRDESRRQQTAITEAYERMRTLKQHLEERVAGQMRTVHAMYEASRAIERQGVGDVLMGITALVRTVLNPHKFSLFLLNRDRLEAVSQEGWQTDDSYAREIEASSPLYAAVIRDRRFLSVSRQADEPLLRGEGLLAGPLINDETGQVVGMLKIEGIGFLDLNVSNVQNFNVLCSWIGAALANAQRVEDLSRGRHATGAASTEQTAVFEARRDLLRHLERSGRLASSQLQVRRSLPRDGAVPEIDDSLLGEVVSRVAIEILGAQHWGMDHDGAGFSRTILLPGEAAGQAEPIAQEFQFRLTRELAAQGLILPIRVTVAALGHGDV